LDDARRDARAIGERGQLATQGMEVEHEPGVVAIGDAGGGQVDAQHRGALGGQRERRGIGVERPEVAGQVVDQVAGDRQCGGPAVLRGAGPYRHARGVAEGERPGRQARQLRPAQARGDRQPIEERPRRAGRPAMGRAVMGGGDESRQLRRSECAPVVASILGRVEPADPGQRIGGQPTILPSPAGERSEGAAVVVARPECDPFRA